MLTGGEPRDRSGSPPTLRRELGRWDLTAVGVNQVIGAAVFAQPAVLAALIGSWSPLLVAAVGCASMMIALCFAEVASRFDGTGGPYLYTRTAFGRFAGFEVGWLMWFTRAASWAAVLNVLATSLGFYWPAASTGVARAGLMTVVVLTLVGINIRGIRESSLVINVLTIAKLLPLVTFALVGLFYLETTNLARTPQVDSDQLAASALLLIFGFGGYEVITVPAGEATEPRRGVPFALVMTLVVVTVLMTLVQVVALGTLPGLAHSRTPLADAASTFLGAGGAALLTLGAVFSTTGNNMGQALSGSRSLFALAEQGDVPPFFGRVHPQFRTPITATVVTAAVALVLALSGTFAAMAAVSAVSRLVVYVATCASLLQLRRHGAAAGVQPARFVVPFGPVIPASAIIVALTILVGATRGQRLSGLVALIAGAALYLVAMLPRSAPTPARS